MATQEQIKSRLKAVKTIHKMTNAMQLVASAKFRQIQPNTERVRKFAPGMTNLWPAEKKDKVEKPNRRTLLVLMCADRGLCGSINTAIVRFARNYLRDPANKEREVGIILLGEKARGALQRIAARRFIYTFSNIGKQKGGVTFRETSMLVEHIVAQKADEILVVYNHFKNSLQYNTTCVNFPILSDIENRDYWFKYNMKNYERTMLSLYEFRFAVMLHRFWYESSLSEQSSRMAAMDNATRNAKQMSESLALTYNRNRQGKITRELLEIISGTVAIEDNEKQQAL